MTTKYKLTYLLSIILITSIILFATVTKTEIGLKIIIKHLVKHIPIKIEHVYGNVSKKIILKKITYSNNFCTISIENISLKIKIKSFKSLLIKNIKIKNLKIQHHKIKHLKNKINLEADAFIKKNLININIKNINGHIHQKELNGKTEIKIKQNKIILKDSIFLLGNNIIQINKKHTLIKLTTPNILHKDFKFKTYLNKSICNNKILIENLVYKNKNIKYITANTSNQKESTHTHCRFSHIKSNDLYTPNIYFHISGYLTNHIINISSKYKQIKLKLHGKILNKRISYIIKKLKQETNIITKPVKLQINKTKFKINKITLTDNFKNNKIIFLSKLRLKTNRRIFGIFYIYYTNANIPEIKMLNKANTYCNVYIKFKIHDKIYYPLISTQSLIKFK